MKTKESCIPIIRRFQAKHAIEATEENVIAAIHLMNSMELDVHAALDQSSRAAGDRGVDAWQLNERESTLSVYQSKFSESKVQVLRGLDDLLHACEWCANDQIMRLKIS